MAAIKSKVQQRASADYAARADLLHTLIVKLTIPRRECFGDAQGRGSGVTDPIAVRALRVW